MLVVSTHLDDAVLSVGQIIEAQPEVRVLTALAGIPFRETTEYDRGCGFDTSQDAVLARRQEDAAAAAVLGYEPIHALHLDQQYHRPPREPLLGAIAATVQLQCRWGHETVLAPLGIGHPDHALVAEACRTAIPGELIVYEDLPYKVLWPEQVAPALDAWRGAGFALTPKLLPAGNARLKRRAIRCYRSQTLDPFDACLNVPERVWRAVRIA